MESTSSALPVWTSQESRSHRKKYGVVAVVALVVVGALMISSVGNNATGDKTAVMKKNEVVSEAINSKAVTEEEKASALGDLSELDGLEDETFSVEASRLENAGNPQLLADNAQYLKMKSDDRYICMVRKVKSPKQFRNGECIADSGHRVLAAAHTHNKFMSVNLCRNICAGMKYKIAGVQYSSHCFCGNKFTRRIQRVNRCNMKCSGNRGQICGGPWANNVYHTGGALGGFGRKLVGCLQDRGARVLRAKHVHHPGMTVQMCSHICKAFRFFGVQYSTHCFCGNGFHGKVVRVNNCNMPCGGNKRQACGGAWANNVYRK